MTQRKNSLLGGALLVAGTSIGGGMLALPVLTSQAGFIPSVVVYLFCWLFMAGTGLLFLEVSQWMKRDSNIVSMANQTLGVWGKYTAWVLYLFLFYCLTIAYLVGCGQILVELFQHQIPNWMGPVLFVGLFAPLILVQTSLAGKLNIILVTGLAISYFSFVILGARFVDPTLLGEMNWKKSLSVLPIAFTSFAYQGIIPTLVSYMEEDLQKTRRAILIGSFIPFIAYVVWQWLILGIVPIDGPGGLTEALQQGQTAIHPLKHFLHNSSVYLLGQSFAFFALVTSFLGVTLGLRDFLADSLKIKKTFRGKLMLVGLILAIPLFVSLQYPHIFLVALDYAGGFGCALLLGLLPILMVWKGRYQLGLDQNPQVKGGRVVLSFMALFVTFEVLAEWFKLFINFN
jgi:tyrosine-specific transport protein